MFSRWVSTVFTLTPSFFRHLPGGHGPPHQSKNLQLPVGQLRRRPGGFAAPVDRGGEHAVGDSGRKHNAAGRRLADGAEEHVDGFVLRHVSPRSGPQAPGGVNFLRLLREHHDPHFRRERDEVLDQGQSVPLAQQELHDQDDGRFFFHELAQLGSGRGTAGDDEVALVGDKPGETFAHGRAVIGDGNSDARSQRVVGD